MARKQYYVRSMPICTGESTCFLNAFLNQFFNLVSETDTTEGATHPETLRFQNCTNSGTIRQEQLNTAVNPPIASLTLERDC